MTWRRQHWQLSSSSRSAYQEEMSAILTVGHVSSSSSLKSLCPILHETILHIDGKTTHGAISFDARHSVIVPRTSWLATLLICYHHDILTHTYQEHVLSKLHEKFCWIPHARSAMLSIIRACIKCRRSLAKKMEQILVDLASSCALTYEPLRAIRGWLLWTSFRHAWALYSEALGVVFTCFNTRALHLELPESLDTISFINVLPQRATVLAVVR